MKQFIVLFLKYIGILFLVCAIFYGINQYLFRSVHFTVPKDKNIVCAGVSFSQFALSDSIIPQMLNVSMKGRSTTATYHTIEHILEHNPHVEYIITDWSVLGVAAYRDYKFFLPVFAPNEFAGSYPLLGFLDYIQYPINPKYYIKSQMRHEWVPNILYLENALKIWRGEGQLEFPFIGEYRPEVGSEIEKSLESFKNHLDRMQSYTDEEAPISKVDIHYMDSIIQLTQRHEVELILFASPVHEKLRAICPERYITESQALIHQHLQKKAFRYLDFQRAPLPDSCFFNVNHLNVHGSKVISERVRDSLRIWGMVETN